MDQLSLFSVLDNTSSEDVSSAAPPCSAAPLHDANLTGLRAGLAAADVARDEPLALAPAGSVTPAVSTPVAVPAASVVRTLGDLLAFIRTSKAVPAARKEPLDRGIRACVAILGRNLAREHAPASAYSVDIATLNRTLFLQPPIAHRLKRRSFINYIGILRMALRYAGLLDQREAAPIAPAAGPWAVLLTNTNCTYAVLGLRRFAAWCHAQGIVPDAVRVETIAEFEAFLTAKLLRANIRHHIGDLGKSWRRLIKCGAVRASGGLRTPDRRVPYVKPLEAFPVGFQQDVAMLVSRLRGGHDHGPFRGDGPPRPLRPRSIDTRVFSIRQAATALVLLGRDPATIRSLSDLVEEPSFAAILTFYWQRAIDLKIKKGLLQPDEVADHREAGVTAQTATMSDALMLIARHHCKLPPDVLARLSQLAADLRPPVQAGINEATRTLLNALSVPARRSKLLSLPKTLMKEAKALITPPERPDPHKPWAPRPREAARLAMIATAIEILFTIPLRITNLVHLRLGVHLKRLDPRSGRISLLSIPEGEMKNAKLFEMPVAAELGAFLQTFIGDWWPLLRPGDDVHLFPGGHGDHSGSRSVDAIRQGIVNAINDHVGLHMRVHDFRAFAIMLLFEDCPGALEDARLLLGHKTTITAQRFYNYIHPAQAAARYQGALSRARQGVTQAALEAHRAGKPTPKPTATRTPNAAAAKRAAKR